jgi:hypothetical protein
VKFQKNLALTPPFSPFTVLKFEFEKRGQATLRHRRPIKRKTVA